MSPLLYFILIFNILASSYWFWMYWNIFSRKTVKYPNYKDKVSLVVPTYNEDEKILTDTINHVKKAKGLHEIIFVNDGSKNNVLEVLKKHNDGSYKIISYEKNQGKRHAQKLGVEKATGDIIVFIDSDTCIMKNTVPYLVRCFNNPEIAGSTANILARNRTENILTKCLSSFYWTSSNVWRRAPSQLNYMQVTNGQCSAYRKKYLMELMNDYITQTFMGQKCHFSDDRWITQQLQIRFKKQIYYEEDAVAYTYVPNNIKQTYKMLYRWRLGAIRETFLVLKDFFKSPLLITDVWFNFIISVMQVIIRVSLIIAIILQPIVLLYYLLAILMISSYYALYMWFYNRKELFYRMVYSIIYEILFSWTTPHALLTIKNQGWVTREVTEK